MSKNKSIKLKDNGFKIQRFLNPATHPSSSSVVAYCGKAPWKKHTAQFVYLRISDCKNTIELHPTDFDSRLDFSKKLKKLEKTIREFRKYLEDVYED